MTEAQEKALNEARDLCMKALYLLQDSGVMPLLIERFAESGIKEGVLPSKLLKDLGRFSPAYSRMIIAFFENIVMATHFQATVVLKNSEDAKVNFDALRKFCSEQLGILREGTLDIVTNIFHTYEEEKQPPKN